MKEKWPEPDPAALEQDEIELVVQVNGKLRGRVPVARETTQDAAYAAALADANIAKFVTGTPKKVVFVPGRLLNIVV